jgi:hypothetical protein
MGLLVIFMEPAENLLSKFLRLEQPATHEIQSGDWLSKLAQEYYGDASYWRELALINRAPDGDLIFPGEKVIVPSFAAIQEIRRSRSLSTVNELVGEQEAILAGRVDRAPEPLAEMQSTKPTKDAQELSSTEMDKPAMPLPSEKQQGTNGEAASFFLSTPVVTGVVILAAVLVIGIFMYTRKKKRDQEVLFYGTSSENAKEGELEAEQKSIYRFDDSEEDYNGSKNKKEKEVISVD